MTGSPDFNLWKLSTDNGKWCTGLPCFHYSIFLLFCALAFYISHLEDSTLVLLRGSLTHESGVWSFDSTRSSFSLSMATKETYMFKCSGDEDCWAFIAFNVIVIKSWFWKKTLIFSWAKKERDQHPWSPQVRIRHSQEAWSWCHHRRLHLDKCSGSQNQDLTKLTRWWDLGFIKRLSYVHGVSLAPAFAKYVTPHGEMAFPLILTNAQVQR